jgi:hypothetical protein
MILLSLCLNIKFRCIDPGFLHSVHYRVHFVPPIKLIPRIISYCPQRCPIMVFMGHLSSRMEQYLYEGVLSPNRRNFRQKFHYL